MDYLKKQLLRDNYKI